MVDNLFMPFKDKAADQAWWIARRIEFRRIIDEAKTRPCVDCGVQYRLAAMQFDHVRGEKRFNIASANGKASSLTTLLAEINKCEVVCANCHAIREEDRGKGRWAISSRKAPLHGR